MSDFLIYWKNFAKDCERNEFAHDNPLSDWRTNSKRLFERLAPGGRIWFVVSGAAFGGSIATAAYLVNVFRLGSVVENRGDDPEYPAADFRYTVLADRSRCRWFDPPLLVDNIVRPPGHDIGRHIGKLLQGPRVLSVDCVRCLEEVTRNAGCDAL